MLKSVNNKVLFSSCMDPEVGDRGPDLLKNHKNKGFLSNTGRDPLSLML